MNEKNIDNQSETILIERDQAFKAADDKTAAQAYNKITVSCIVVFLCERDFSLSLAEHFKHFIAKDSQKSIL